MIERIALGTVQFGCAYGVANKQGQISFGEATSIIDCVGSVGVNTLDTAAMYGNSESCLGAIGVKNFNVITKLPALTVDVIDVKSWVDDQIETSLRKLNISSLDGILIHQPEQLFGPQARVLLKSLEAAKNSGLVKKIGISIYSPRVLKDLENIINYDIIQAPFNILDTRLLTSGWMDKLYKRGVEIHARSTFLQGLLLMGANEMPSYFSRWSNLLREYRQYLLDKDLNALQTCLHFSLSRVEISRVVIGVDSLMHLMQILYEVERPFPGPFPEISIDDEMLINPTNWPKF